MWHAVEPDEAGTRADVLVARLSGASRSRVARAIERGSVRIDGLPIKGSRPLEAGDRIEFDIPPERALRALPQDIAVPIVYEDDDLLVVDKPAGMVTHPAAGARHGTLVNALVAHTGGTLPGDALRPGLVHRLDRDTSGLLVVAKTADALAALQAAMQTRRIRREYVGLTIGVPSHPSGTLDGAIGRDPRNRLRFAVLAGGKPAITHYDVIEAWPANAELRFRLETGRTHQIRVHAAAMGHPILNDPTYGRIAPEVDLPGQALHARHLSFPHPRTGARMEFDSEPPAGYVAARERLRRGG